MNHAKKKGFALTWRSQVRQAYAALPLFLTLHKVWFEPSLGSLTKIWGISAPKYCSFYDGLILPKTLKTTDLTVSEEASRLRAIITMRVLALFRDINLARTTKDVLPGVPGVPGRGDRLSPGVPGNPGG